VRTTQQTLQKWLPRLAFYLFGPAVALVGWGELSSEPAAIEVVFWDKSLHFIAYFGLSGLICLALKADWRVPAATLLIALLGAVLELLQGLVGRDPSVYDEIANILGAVTGAGTGWLVVRLLQPKTLAAPPAN
jgi:VanZ family protein